MNSVKVIILMDLIKLIFMIFKFLNGWLMNMLVSWGEKGKREIIVEWMDGLYEWMNGVFEYLFGE